MDVIINELNDRSQDTSDFISLVKFINNVNSHILSDKYEDKFYITPNLRKTLNGLTFLLIYNTIESTMRSSMYRIHQDMEQKKVCFDDLRTEIKKTIFKQFSKNNSKNLLVDGLKEISFDICHKFIDRRKIFSGNIDRKAINNTIRTYGIKFNDNENINKKSKHLCRIKENRNDLAHGDATYSDIGKNYSLSDIVEIITDTEEFLFSFVELVERYIQDKQYLSG